MKLDKIQLKYLSEKCEGAISLKVFINKETEHKATSSFTAVYLFI